MISTAIAKAYPLAPPNGSTAPRNASHGISRIPIYAKRIQEGRISAKPTINFEVMGSVLKVDGDNGLGQVVSYRAIEKALSLAKINGITGVFIRNSNHFGTAAYFLSACL